MEIDDKLKNRLAGTAVITALAIIFLPMLFDDPVQKKGQVVSELDIPHKPEVSPLLNTAIIPDKNTQALSKAELSATNPHTETAEQSGTEADSETVPLNTESAASEEENPPALEKKASHKKAAEASDDTEKKTKSLPHKEHKSKPSAKDDHLALASKKTVESRKEESKPVKPKEPKHAAEEKKSAKGKAELPVLDSTYQDKSETAAKAAAPAATNRRWVIQVASLSDQAKATALRDKLRGQGFPATVDSVWLSGKGRVYRLKVGPELDAEKAQSMKAKINQLNHVNSIAVSE